MPFLVLNFGFDIVNGVRGLNLEGNGFARKAMEMTLNVEYKTMRESTHVFTKICMVNRTLSSVQRI